MFADHPGSTGSSRIALSRSNTRAQQNFDLSDGANKAPLLSLLQKPPMRGNVVLPGRFITGRDADNLLTQRPHRKRLLKPDPSSSGQPPTNNCRLLTSEKLCHWGLVILQAHHQQLHITLPHRTSTSMSPHRIECRQVDGANPGTASMHASTQTALSDSKRFSPLGLKTRLQNPLREPIKRPKGSRHEHQPIPVCPMQGRVEQHGNPQR